MHAASVLDLVVCVEASPRHEQLKENQLSYIIFLTSVGKTVPSKRSIFQNTSFALPLPTGSLGCRPDVEAKLKRSNSVCRLAHDTPHSVPRQYCSLSELRAQHR